MSLVLVIICYFGTMPLAQAEVYLDSIVGIVNKNHASYAGKWRAGSGEWLDASWNDEGFLEVTVSLGAPKEAAQIVQKCHVREIHGKTVIFIKKPLGYQFLLLIKQGDYVATVPANMQGLVQAFEGNKKLHVIEQKWVPRAWRDAVLKNLDEKDLKHLFVTKADVVFSLEELVLLGRKLVK